MPGLPDFDHFWFVGSGQARSRLGRVASTQASLRSLRKLGCAASAVGVVRRFADGPPPPTPPSRLRAARFRQVFKSPNPGKPGFGWGGEQTEFAARMISYRTNRFWLFTQFHLHNMGNCG
jgi:hypothetical protein